MTATRALNPPVLLDFVPAQTVRALIEQVDRDFTDLEHRAADATALADELEARAADEGIGPQSSQWGMEKLQRFLDDMRDEVDRDAAATVEVARHRARVL